VLLPLLLLVVLLVVLVLVLLPLLLLLCTCKHEGVESVTSQPPVLFACKKLPPTGS
jgi:hypothetical protein